MSFSFVKKSELIICGGETTVVSRPLNNKNPFVKISLLSVNSNLEYLKSLLKKRATERNNIKREAKEKMPALTTVKMVRAIQNPDVK